MAFKMNGWSGLQKPSPVNKKLDFSKIQADFAKVQGSIQNLFKGKNSFKPKTSSKSTGLSDIEKKEAKKLGMSEYQWRSGANLTHEQWVGKNRFEKKHDLGKHEKESNIVDGNEVNKSSLSSEELSVIESKIVGDHKESLVDEPVDYGDGATTSDWKRESTTGWSLHELQQERDNVIKVEYGVNSSEYENIQKAINKAYGY